MISTAPTAEAASPATAQRSGIQAGLAFLRRRAANQPREPEPANGDKGGAR
jgi:hypothetical protein